MIDSRLITFITVAKTNNFTRAAEILNLTQPAVYQQVQYLETHYGVKFIKKEGRHLKLTEEGKILLEYAKEMYAISQNMEEKLKDSSSIIRRHRIGATMTIGGYVLPHILGKYKNVNNNVNITLHVDNTNIILKKLIDREIELAIVEGPFDKKKFKFKNFKDDELILAASPNHDFASRKSVELEEVLEGNLLLREQGSGTREIFESELIRRGYSPDTINAHMEVGSITSLVSLVEYNAGYTIISREAIQKELEQGTIVVVPIKNFSMLREFNFIYIDEKEMEFINDFINFCYEIN
ncbi:LysR family transcriptional regulator [Clostridium sp. Marseille-QA1073]